MQSCEATEQNSVKVSLPSSVKSISTEAFRECSKLSQVVIPESVTMIDSYAFYSCGALLSVLVPSSVLSIGSGAFMYSSKLSNVTVVGNGEINIAYNAFTGCHGLHSMATSSADCVSFGWQRADAQTCEPKFACQAAVTLPEGITSIPDGAFQNCKALMTISIPSTVTSIGASAFNGGSAEAGQAKPKTMGYPEWERGCPPPIPQSKGHPAVS